MIIAIFLQQIMVAFTLLQELTTMAMFQFIYSQNIYINTKRRL